MYDDAVHIEGWLHDRLVEWGRWAKARGWHTPACRSIESRYLPPAGDVFRDPDEEPPPLPISERAAWAVECAWREGLNRGQRTLLRAYYITAPAHGSWHVWKRHVDRTCRLLHMSRHLWGVSVSSAARTLGNILTAREGTLMLVDVSSTVHVGERVPKVTA